MTKILSIQEIAMLWAKRYNWRIPFHGESKIKAYDELAKDLKDAGYNYEETTCFSVVEDILDLTVPGEHPRRTQWIANNKTLLLASLLNVFDLPIPKATACPHCHENIFLKKTDI